MMKRSLYPARNENAAMTAGIILPDGWQVRVETLTFQALVGAFSMPPS